MGTWGVLIPVFNDEPRLGRTLTSLSREAVRMGERVQVIIVDDGSERAVEVPSMPMLDCYVIRKERNEGLAEALNTGVSYALKSGWRYVARLDAGDEVVAGRFEAQLNLLEARPEYVMVGGQVKWIDRDGREPFKERFPLTDGEIRRAMHARGCIVHAVAMMRVDALVAAGMYKREYEPSEDYELKFRMARLGRLANVDKLVGILDWEGLSLRRRRAQLLKRLRVMLENFDPRVIESYLGIIKAAVMLGLPVGIVVEMKRLLGERRGGGWL